MTLGEMIKVVGVEICVEIRDENNMNFISAVKMDSRALEPYYENEVVGWFPGRSKNKSCTEVEAVIRIKVNEGETCQKSE